MCHQCAALVSPTHPVGVMSPHLPGVYEVPLPGPLSVAVEDEVAVTAIKEAVRGWIHRNLLPILNTPDLKANQESHSWP